METESKFFVEKHGGDLETVKESIRSIVNIYVDSTTNGKLGSMDFSRVSLINKVKGAISPRISCFFGDRIKNQNLRSKLLKWIYGEYYLPEFHDLFVYSKYFSGVPFYTSDGMKKIKEISEYIRKYPVQ